MLFQSDAGLFQMTLFGFGELAFQFVLEAKLNGCVAFLLVGLFLNDDTGAGLDNGDRYYSARLIEDLRHADLFADDSLFHVISSLQVIGWYLLIGNLPT